MNNRIFLFVAGFFIICLFFWWGRGPKSITGGEAHEKQYELTFFQKTVSGIPKNNNFIPADTNNTLVELNINGNPSKLELENLIIFDSSGNEMEFIYDKDVLKNGLEFSENTNNLWLFKNNSDHWKVGYNSESDIGKFNFDVKDFGWIFVHGKDVIFLAIIVSSLILLYFIQKAGYGEKIYLRPIAGLKAIEEAVGRATEMGKSVLFVPGISDLDQVETVAGLNLLGHVAGMTAKYETALNVPVSKSIVMEAGREACKESYLKAGRPDLYYDDMVHYLTDDQFAYAAGVNGIMLREKPAACFYLGKFYAESLLLAETGNSIGAIQIAGTGSPAQIPFFVTACDYTLIGEEFFTASAYLSNKPDFLGSIKGQDIVKLLVMVAMILTILLNGFFQAGWISYNILTLFVN